MIQPGDGKEVGRCSARDDMRRNLHLQQPFFRTEVHRGVAEEVGQRINGDQFYLFCDGKEAVNVDD